MIRQQRNIALTLRRTRTDCSSTCRRAAFRSLPFRRIQLLLAAAVFTTPYFSGVQDVDTDLVQAHVYVVGGEDGNDHVRSTRPDPGGLL
ncbi:Uncharacterised protein [Mycobacteroides abscessus subsp. abscessus]|nr:Uncharacterised protein [Mycobacteroides abscessus subsp. abscessus]